MQNKKSFVLYTDLIYTLEKLSDENAGQLFKHLLRYVNDLEPKTDNVIIDVVFEGIRQQLKRDLVKWGTTREGRSKAGKASAEARRLKKEQELTNPTNVKSVQQTPTKSTVSVSVSDSVILFNSFWNIYDKKTGKDKCQKKFLSLKDDEQEKILEVVKAYVKSTPDIKYRKNPLTWLNGKHWEDEIKQEKKSPSAFDIINRGGIA